MKYNIARDTQNPKFLLTMVSQGSRLEAVPETEKHVILVL